MKSFWILTEGGRTVVEPRETPVPQPGPGEIGVRVAAAGLNRGGFITGGVMHGTGDKPGGTEVAGEVVSLGPGVTGWSVGDRVMGRVFGPGRGAFAEATAIRAHEAMPVPEHYSWEEAAAIPSSFLAAYDAVFGHGRPAQGDWVLVTGAASAVGVAAVQIARLLGARTIGTSGSQEKLWKLEEIGLDAGIATRKPGFAAKVREIAPDGISLAVNCVGGSMLAECLGLLRVGGRLATVGYMDGVLEAPIDLRELHANRLVVFGISNSRISEQGRVATVEGFSRDVLPALMDGRLRPLIDRVFAFDELPAAKDYMESDAQVGKIVVRVQDQVH